MKTLRPEKVYVTEEVFSDPLSAQRVERMMGGIECDLLETVSDAELNELVPLRGWDQHRFWGSIEHPTDPDLVFTTAKFHTEQEQAERRTKYPNLSASDLYGYRTHMFRRDGLPEWRKQTKGVVCQPAWQLHSIHGCPFRCDYCPFGSVIRILVNMEEYSQHLNEWLALAPNQRLYKWDNSTDIPCFEPEYGAAELLVDYFARQEEKYLEIYVGKSDNIDYLLGLDHRGHTILQWSMAPRTQSTLIEKETAPMERRIEAASKCQEAGYLVRYRFSPIIPVKNWRDEYREMIELIFAQTKPDVISLCAFGWMSLESARQCLDFALWDQEFVAAMEVAAPFLEERGYTVGGGHPIPHDARLAMFNFLIDQIQRISPKTVIALCLDTQEMWSALGEKIGQNPQQYVCNCGPRCTPGAPLYDQLVGKRPRDSVGARPDASST